MKRAYVLLIVTGVFILLGGLNVFLEYEGKKKTVTGVNNLKETGPGEPSEWFYLMRTNPGEVFDYKAYIYAINEANQQDHQKAGMPGTNAAWTLEGPTNINGRINCIAVHPQNNQTIYVGSASGGVFRSLNGGTSWSSVFDEFSYLAVGDIEFDPKNNNTIWVGTGDPNISGYPFIGAGIFKSTDAGATWNYSGLGNTFIISRICIHPKNPDTVYAATMGLPFVRDNNRGLYKSTDGGQTWTQILFLSNQAGIIDLIMDPHCPDTLYAAGWDRIRNNQESVVSGTAAKIWKTTNGGQSWTMLTSGLPSTDMSRIGLWMSATNSQVIFASYVSPTLDLQGIYKTTNGGQNWSALNISSLPPDVMGGFGWYFGQIRVNPANDNDIFILGVDLWRTTDGGSYWYMATPPWYDYVVHADKHDLYYLSPTSFLLAADGGLYKTNDNTANWTDVDATPSTQVYRVNYNPHEPGVYYCGAQDNGTLGGSAAQLNNWMRYLGGDGFQPLFDPYDPWLRYYEVQNGALYYDDGFSIEDFTMGIDPTDRRSWDMPVIISEFDNMRMYTGTYRVYKMSAAPYGSWSPISSDLTDGVIYGDRYHVITTVEESPINQNTLYAGTSDANVWRSLNGGANWTNITGTLPNQYVTHIKASPTNQSTVFVSHSGYRSNDFIPHIHKSTDNGSTWTDISGDLPPLAINNIEIPAGYNDDIILVATDGGVYVTIDGGTAWHRLGNNMPPVAVYDIVYDTLLHKIAAGTYGRAIQSYGLDSLFQHYLSITGNVDNVLNNNNINVFPNPAREKIHIFLEKNLTSGQNVCIFDVSGVQYFLSTDYGEDICSIDVSDLPPGLYILAIIGEGRKYSGFGKFIKTD